MTDIDWSEVEHHLRCRYTDINVVGQGGMGRAYKVKDKSGAVKVVKTTSIPDDKYMQAEYDFLVLLRHPNLAYVYKSFYAYGYLAMEMDWYTGGDLWALIYHGQMPEPKMAPMPSQDATPMPS